MDVNNAGWKRTPDEAGRDDSARHESARRSSFGRPGDLSRLLGVEASACLVCLSQDLSTADVTGAVVQKETEKLPTQEGKVVG